MSDPATVTYWILQHQPSGPEAAVNRAPNAGLSLEEQARAERFHFPEDAARYRFFHQRLRELLVAVLPGALAPEALEFSHGPQGKPCLRHHPGLHFNLTHTQEFGAVAISHAGPVGIDLERVDTSFPCREVARNYFQGDEIAAVWNAPTGATGTERFFRLWTAKEAIMKATGLGMTLEPPQIALELDPVTQSPVGIRSLSSPFTPAADWKLYFPEVAAGLSLAIATRPEVTKVVLGS